MLNFSPFKKSMNFSTQKITLFFGKKRIDQRNATEMHAIWFKGAIRIECKQDIKKK